MRVAWELHLSLNSRTTLLQLQTIEGCVPTKPYGGCDRLGDGELDTQAVEDDELLSHPEILRFVRGWHSHHPLVYWTVVRLMRSL